MTILEELIDLGLRTCESQRSVCKTAYARSAVILSNSGKTYVGCDMVIPGEQHPIGAEKAAFLSAVADGAAGYEVICRLVGEIDQL
jgi:cytidine deaminase